MKSNWTVKCDTPMTEYEVNSKGIRRIRTTKPGDKDWATAKRAKEAPAHKPNWTVKCNTPLTEYLVNSKGIRHIRTTLPGERPKDGSERDKPD